MNESTKTARVLQVLVGLFLLLAVAFLLNLWGRSAPRPQIPLVDPKFIDPATVRQSYADITAAKGDLSDFDCYGCHDKKKPPTLRFDGNQTLIIPQEHSDIVMAHGSHNRNNNCFNCHDENNLEQLQTRDGHQVSFADSPQLCGSCHGPTYRDWMAGAHGRVSGYWNHNVGEKTRKACVSCHNPHSPKFPGRQPAPPPHPLHPLAKPSGSTEGKD